MARLADPRPRGRPHARIVAVTIGVGVVLVAGVIGLSGAVVATAPPPSPPPLLAVASSAGSSPGGPLGSPGATSPAPSSPASPPPAVGPTRADLYATSIRARLQVALDAARKRFALPGVSVTVLFPDGTTWLGSSGLADVKARRTVDSGTAFALGSISKTYTAALILALAGEGRIALDAPARLYLPGSTLDRRITVSQLLNHTSGLDDFFIHPPIDRALLADRAAPWTPARSLGYVGKRYFPPGRGWHYSNTNYLYLGLIAERVGGKPLADQLRERFFTPLGLDDTWYQAAEKPRTETAHGYRFATAKRTAPPIDLSDGTPVVPFTSVVTAAAGAGSIAATSSDVARWARALYRGEVLGPAMTAEMLEAILGTAAYAPRVGYGFGVQAFPIGGRASLGHSGRLLGFRAAVRYLPGEDVTIAVLTNQSRADPGRIVQELLEVVFTPPPMCTRCSQPA
jgi:D-alanyl-D-alanine carboxypeptidase